MNFGLKNFTFFIVATMALVTVIGATYYFVVQVPAKRVAELGLEKAKLVSQENQRQQDKEARLNECLGNVEKDYKRKLELNSVSVPTEEYPDARRWNSSQVKLGVEKKYNDDRDFCLERYK